MNYTQDATRGTEVRAGEGATRTDEDDGTDGETRAPAVTDTEVTRSSTQDPSAEAYPIDIGQVCEILKNQRRRYVLRYLNAVEEQVTLSDLAERIAAWEFGKELGQITSQERKRVYVGLYQCHLPKMNDVSAVSYNQERGWIEQGEHTGLFVHYLPDDEIPAGDDPDGRGEDGPHWGLSLLGTVRDYFR